MFHESSGIGLQSDFSKPYFFLRLRKINNPPLSNVRAAVPDGASISGAFKPAIAKLEQANTNMLQPMNVFMRCRYLPFAYTVFHFER